MERSGTAFPQGLKPELSKEIFGMAQPVPSQKAYLTNALTTDFCVSFGELQFVQSPVSPQLLHEFFVRANIADGAILEHRDAVGASYGRKPMCDYQYSTPAHEILQSRLDQCFRLAVECRGHFV